MRLADAESVDLFDAGPREITKDMKRRGFGWGRRRDDAGQFVGERRGELVERFLREVLDEQRAQGGRASRRW